MRFQIRKCIVCKRFTLKDNCPNCGKKTEMVHPAKFSPDDKYVRYRLSDRYN
ncbi:MAG: RNA-protein complex protein Nop10 [Nitrosopumilaceae archaeon]